MNKDKIKQLNHQLKENIELIFDDLNLDFEYGDLESVRGPCPVHEGHNNTSFVFWRESGTWRCFSHSCHEKHGDDVLGLIKGVTKNNFGKSIQYGKDILTKYGKKLTVELDEIKNSILSINKRDIVKEHCNQEVLDKKMLSNLASPRDYCVGRNISAKIAMELDCGIAVQGFMRNRFIIPITNINNEFVGVVGRDPTWYAEKHTTKWQLWPREAFKKSLNLYNIAGAQEAVKDDAEKTYFVVEGAIDVFRLIQAGFKNSLAIMGSDLSMAQIELLKHLGAVNIILVMDPDEPGKEAAIRNRRKLEKKLFSVHELDWPYSYDLGDENCTIEQVQEAVSKLGIYQS